MRRSLRPGHYRGLLIVVNTKRVTVGVRQTVTVTPLRRMRHRAWRTATDGVLPNLPVTYE